MLEKNYADHARVSALDRIERSEQNQKRLLVVAAFVEALFLLAFVLLADFSNRLQVLILLSAVAVYTILAVGLFALGNHINRCTDRVLKAVELLEGRSRL